MQMEASLKKVCWIYSSSKAWWNSSRDFVLLYNDTNWFLHAIITKNSSFTLGDGMNRFWLFKDFSRTRYVRCWSQLGCPRNTTKLTRSPTKKSSLTLETLRLGHTREEERERRKQATFQWLFWA